MKRIATVVLASLLLSSIPAMAQKKPKKEEKPEVVFQRWLTEDVRYIISEPEEKTFKALKSDDERALFIEQFWLRRDPTPDTARNEFKEQHYERIAYANAHFAAGEPGWKTDRGRIYILLGPPADIEAHPMDGSIARAKKNGTVGTVQAFPFEIWRYRQIQGIGTDVSLEFDDQFHTDQYRLSTQAKFMDGLANHVTGGWSEQPSAASETGDDPTIRLSELELEKSTLPPPIKLTDLKDLVTTRLSFSVLPFDVRTDFVKGAEDNSVLTPVTIRFSVKDLQLADKGDGKRGTSIHVLGQFTAVDGRIAQSFDETMALEFSAATLEQDPERNMLYQKGVALAPGNYALDIALEDRGNGHRGTLRESLTVPRFTAGKLETSSLILADVIQQIPEGMTESGAFVLGRTAVQPNVRGEFLHDRTLYLWLQVYGVSLNEETQKPAMRVETVIRRGTEEVRRVLSVGSQFPSSGSQSTVTQIVPLKDFTPGDYVVQMNVTDNVTKQVISSTEKFVVQ